MSIASDVVILNQPYGNPGSVGEPLGLWIGSAAITGDASGGDVELRFVPQNPATTPTLLDHRRIYLWFIDGVQIVADGDPGNVGVTVQLHMARPNTAIASPFSHSIAVPTITEGLRFAPTEQLIADHWTRSPIFWDTEELASGNNVIVHCQAENNVLNRGYNFNAFGRYYDKRILSNRAFGRLVGPPAISQFEG